MEQNTDTNPATTSKNVAELDSAIIRFAGDSGDGMQVTGTQFSNESALAGNDIATLPDFPAEIRAPAGTLAGVSGFQINIGSMSIHTPGDNPDVLVAMNPAALKANISDVKANGIVILNEDAFTEKNLKRVGYESNPANDETLRNSYQVFSVPITKLTKKALEDTSLTAREVERCKNFFALGVMLWMFDRPSEHTVAWIERKFSKRPEIADANKLALKAGIIYGEATEIFTTSYKVPPAKQEPGEYRNINGTTAMAYGLIAATQKSGIPLFFGAYPITPASDLLHELAKHKRFGITTFQAEDEIAAVCSAIGASYTGALGVTSSSGPGIALKGEALGLGVIVELPLIVFNMQRGGPSTGLPTKTEQSDLFQALYGRSGEAPMCIVSTSGPGSAFQVVYDACRIAVKYMTPVMILSDGYINNCSEPWAIPDTKELAEFDLEPIKRGASAKEDFAPYARKDDTLSRPWATPGTPELMHRVGGLEKEDTTGNVSYDPDNHHKMVALREEKIRRIAQEIPATEIEGEESGELLVVGWGSTEGAIKEAVKQVRADGLSVSRIHVHYLNPLPNDLGDILSRFKRVLVPEINMGQFRSILRDKYLVDAQGFNVVRGKPLQVSELADSIRSLLQMH